MNEHDTTAHGNGRSAEEVEVERLLRQAGPRPEVPADDLAVIQAAFRAEWRAQVASAHRPRPWAAYALAAAALVAALGAAWWWSGWWSVDPGWVARAESLAGAVALEVELAGGETIASPLWAGAEIPAQAVLATAGPDAAEPGRAGLRLAGGPSLRLAAGSRVRLVSAKVLALEAGTVYLDSGPEPGRGGRVEVRTAAGVARDIGTQFEVALLDGGDPALRVRVREGTVLVERGEISHRAAAGQELTLRADGSVARRAVAPTDPAWEWILEAAPPFAIEGRTLAEFLRWVERETGWEIRFADPEVEAAAGSILLHGSLGDLGPDQAPAVVLPGAGLAHRLTGNTLLILRAQENPGDG